MQQKDTKWFSEIEYTILDLDAIWSIRQYGGEFRLYLKYGAPCISVTVEEARAVCKAIGQPNAFDWDAATSQTAAREQPPGPRQIGQMGVDQERTRNW